MWSAMGASVRGPEHRDVPVSVAEHAGDETAARGLDSFQSEAGAYGKRAVIYLRSR